MPQKTRKRRCDKISPINPHSKKLTLDDTEDCAAGLESQDDEGLTSPAQSRIDSSIAKAFTSFLSGEHARNLFSELIKSAVATAISDDIRD